LYLELTYEGLKGSRDSAKGFEFQNLELTYEGLKERILNSLKSVHPIFRAYL